MKCHHIAFWTNDIEKLATFYKRYFEGHVLFRHSIDDFRCIFMRICEGVLIEIMSRTGLSATNSHERVGYSHLSLEVASRAEVNRLTEYFRGHNVPLVKDREQYDDGFYESAILDPDGNIIELAYIDRNVNPMV
ncbi:MAG: VOC family protein [Deltaproteobacteria bacterium]|nr:VOC family protein [Deltaproteobacteria bacterium]